MFGYVRISKAQMDKENFDLFRAYYCGLCKGIGKRSSFARLGLSYDMTFLFILLSAISKDEPIIENSRCMLHPFKREKAIKKSKELDYVSDMSILLVLKKLEDDWNDEKSIKALFLKTFYKFAKRKIKYKDKEEAIEKELSRLSQLEKENCEEPDCVADCFAKICEIIFTPDFIECENTKKILAWLGYNIGRWIYLIDALDDLKEDALKKSYNPFLKKSEDEGFLKNLSVTLTFNLSNIGGAYDLLDIKRNDDILKNIIYIGLFNMQSEILKKQEEKDESL